MNANGTTPAWIKAITEFKERLAEPILWYPYPALIAFALVTILSGHLLTYLNPRLGTSVEVIPLEAPRLILGDIWLGIKLNGDVLEIMTTDRHIFRWKNKSLERKDMSALIDYLKEKTRHQAHRAGLKMKAMESEIRAIIAIDKNVSYAHLNPVLYALAEAKISKYGFESRIIN